MWYIRSSENFKYQFLGQLSCPSDFLHSISQISKLTLCTTTKWPLILCTPTFHLYDFMHSDNY